VAKEEGGYSIWKGAFLATVEIYSDDYKPKQDITSVNYLRHSFGFWIQFEDSFYLRTPEKLMIETQLLILPPP
jgi:hypothetical protein